jgi:hypothetical protein
LETPLFMAVIRSVFIFTRIIPLIALNVNHPNLHP